MIDMSSVMVARSDQINAPDLLNKPRTIKIVGVKLTGKEQATEIRIADDDKVYRPCKSMVRVMARAWGNDGEKWVGNSATLFCDPKVRFGKDVPGGIRISHLSGLRDKMVVCLQASKGVLKNYEIEPLPAQRDEPAAANAAPTLESRLNAFLAALNKTPDRAALVALQHRAEALIMDVTNSGPELFTRMTEAIATRDATFETPDFNDGSE